MKMPKRELTAEFRELAVTPDARFGQSVLACHAEITRRHEGKAGVVKRSTTPGIDSESIPAEISYKPEIRCALRLLTYPTNAAPRVRHLHSQVLVFARAHFQKCHYNSANCSGAAGFSIPKA